MTSKFDAVIGSDGDDFVLKRQELIAKGFGNGHGGHIRDLLKQDEPRASLDEREDRPTSSAADDGIAFPVAEPLAAIDNGWAFADRSARVPTSAFTILMDSLAVFVTTP